MKPDVGHLYTVLRQWAVAKNRQTYMQLSHDYHKQTGVWFEPHGNWDTPLGDLNNLLASVGAPALSALVVLQETKEPGDGFWGCASNAPSRPKNDIDRLAVWSLIVKDVIAFNWPVALP